MLAPAAPPHALTSSPAPLYSDCMHTEKAREQLEQELERLEGRVEELVAVCAKLRGDNHSLRERLESLSTERSGLLAKNEQVRGRVEAMISRLKSLEESA
ncbi:MAG: TIGR02449 family protein [Gammaproteobacteria bacterium]